MKQLACQGVSVEIAGATILHGVDLQIEAGEMLGLVGPNGAGKTTLLKAIAGLVPRLDGEILLDQQPIDQLNANARARCIAYLAQQGTAQWPLSVRRIVELGRIPHASGWLRSAMGDESVIDRVLSETELHHLQHRSFNSLSGGEQRRVLLARALVGEPALILADEPVAALDPYHQYEVMRRLRAHSDSGGCVIVVLHDLALAAHFCDRLQLIDCGKTVISGEPEMVLTNQYLESVYRIRLLSAGKGGSGVLQLPWTVVEPQG